MAFALRQQRPPLAGSSKIKALQIDLVSKIASLARGAAGSLLSKLSKGCGHNSYGEPAWPNDILYIFPIVILGMSASVNGLAIHEGLEIEDHANAFSTPLEILPEWYLFPVFNLLRALPEKCIGILSILALAPLLLRLPLAENLNRYQNPFRRPAALALFLGALARAAWLGLGPLAPIPRALPGSSLL